MNYLRASYRLSTPALLGLLALWMLILCAVLALVILATYSPVPTGPRRTQPPESPIALRRPEDAYLIRSWGRRLPRPRR